MKPFLISSLLLILFHFHGTAQHSISVIPNQDSYSIGARVTVEVTSDPVLTSGAWLGIFPANSPQSNTKGYLDYKYVSLKNKTTILLDLPGQAGAYELRLIDAKPERLVTAYSIQLKDIDARDVDLILPEKEIKPNHPMTVQIKSDLTFNPKAWAGIFESDADPSSAAGYLTYEYFYEKNEVTVNAPSTPGQYELRFYTADPGKLLKQIPFYVGPLDLPGLNIVLNKTDYLPEEHLIVDYTGHDELITQSWIGLFPTETDQDEVQSYLNYHYLADKLKGQVTFRAPAVKGAYKISMVYANQGPIIFEGPVFNVTSSLDKTYLEDKMEANGEVVLYGIYFDTDKSEVKTKSLPLIQQIADMLSANPDMNIMIEGHTDAQGDEAYNQKLSERRAEAIRSILVSKHNIPSAQLQTIGQSESKPVGDNATPSGRALNRRVVLVRQ